MKKVVLTNDNVFFTSSVILTDSKGTVDRIVLYQKDHITGKEAKLVLPEKAIYKIMTELLEDEQNNLLLNNLHGLLDSIGRGIIPKLFIYRELIFRLSDFPKMEYQEQLEIVEEIYYEWIDSELELIEVIDEKVEQITEVKLEKDEDLKSLIEEIIKDV
ncbi:hypothetical protein ACAG39_01785 [Caldicellulosiruptoraceae bacterium PP1]